MNFFSQCFNGNWTRTIALGMMGQVFYHLATVPGQAERVTLCFFLLVPAMAARIELSTLG
jgi:hypothetical protein